MNNREVFYRDPSSTTIPNLGVAKVGEPQSPQEWEVLDYELRNFVCEGEYRRGLEIILETFLSNLGQPQQPAAWVSGFYGSGKSHFARVLESLWRDTTIPSGGTARGITPLPDDIKAHLKELSSRGKQVGGLWSAAGKLGAGADSIRLALLSILLRSAGLPEQYQQGRFVLYLTHNGLIDGVRAELERRDKTLDHELNYMLLSPHLAESLLKVQPTLADDVKGVHALLSEEYPHVEEITNDEFLRLFEQILDSKSLKPGKAPLTLVVFDELQQFLAGDLRRTEELLRIVEDVSSRFESRVLFVATGQSQMGSTPELQWLQDRFSIKVTLSDTDVESVVRKVVLLKSQDKVSAVEAAIDAVRGEIDRHLAGSSIAASPNDTQDLVRDYPLLPTRRRFWERLLRGIDVAGREGQLRTQLRIVHDATKEVADRALGNVVPTEVIYDYQRADMLQSGVLLRDVAKRIDELQGSDAVDALLSARIAKMVFLIGKLPTEGVYASGVKANAEMITDLLVDDLNAGSATLRQRAPGLLDSMVTQGMLMHVEGEYRLQTAEGAEWEQDFRRREQLVRADDARMQSELAAELKRTVESAIKGLSFVQGKSKTPRKLSVHFGDQPPPSDSGDIPLWIRDEWSDTARRVRDDAQASGVDSPIISVFLPKRSPDELRTSSSNLAAREETLNARPHPTTPEGQEARASMDSQKQLERNRLDRLVAAVLKDALVLQGGGTEVNGANFAESVRIAAEASLARMFAKFNLADDQRWGTVLQRIRSGSADPLGAVGHNGEAHDHAVCREILSFIGNTPHKGSEIRQRFQGSGYGWPRDAIDGGLLALVATGQLVAEKNKSPVEARHIEQGQIGSVEYRRESFTVSATKRIELRKLAQDVLGTPVKAGEELEATRQVLDRLVRLAEEAGGEAPLPAPPGNAGVERLRQLVGNQQLIDVHAERVQILADFKEWSSLKARAAERLPRWSHLTRLIQHARSLPVANELSPQVDATRDNRSLLSDPDPVTPLLQRASDTLRDAIVDAHRAVEDERAAMLADLEATAEWNALNDAQREDVLASNSLRPIPNPALNGDEEVLTSLDDVPLDEWKDKLAAVAGRVMNARAQAAKITEPKAISVKLPSATLKTPEDVEKYLDQVRKAILDKLDDGPVIV